MTQKCNDCKKGMYQWSDDICGGADWIDNTNINKLASDKTVIIGYYFKYCPDCGSKLDTICANGCHGVMEKKMIEESNDAK